MRIRITHIDGKLPNLALMRLAHFHRQRGDEIYFSKSITPQLFEQCPECHGVKIECREILGRVASGFWQCQDCGCQWDRNYYPATN
jgi:ribosomal protein L37AE/L43A